MTCPDCERYKAAHAEITKTLLERDRQYLDLIEKCDAYREVAINWVISETETKTKSKEKCVEQVDSQAAQLIESKRRQNAANSKFTIYGD